MKTICFVLIYFLFVKPAIGQTRALASLPDSCFDQFVYLYHPEQARQAKHIFSERLANLSRQNASDSLALAVNYRRLGVTCQMLSDREGAKSNYQASFRIMQALPVLPEADWAMCLHNYSVCLAATAAYDSAFQCLEQAVAIDSRLYGPGDIRVSLHYCFIAGYCINVSKINQGLEYAIRAVSILERSGKYVHPFMVRVLQVRGTLYIETHAYDRALQDFSRAEQIALKTLDPIHPLLTNIYSALGRTFLLKGDYEGAEDYLSRCLAIREQTLGMEHELTGYTSMALGEIALELRDSTKAVRCYERYFDILKKLHGELPLDRYPFLMGLYRKVGQFDRVEQAFDLVTRTFTITDFTRKDIAYCYGEYANMLIQQRRFREALTWLRKTQELLFIQNPDEPTALHVNFLMQARCHRMLQQFDEAETSVRQITENRTFTDMLRQVHTELGEINTARFEHSHAPADLDRAWGNFQTAMHYMDSIRFTTPAMGSRLQQAEMNFHIFDKAMYTATLRGQAGDAFLLSEKAKTQTLLEDLQNNEALLMQQIPDSLWQLEKRLKTEIADLENRLFNKKPGADATVEEAMLFERKKNFFEFIHGLEKDYPDYCRLKYAIASLSLDTVRQQIVDDSTALLEYFIGDSLLHIFVLTRDSLYWHFFPKPADFEKTIWRLRKSITDNQLRTLGEDYSLFAECSGRLYDVLLAYPLSRIPASVRHLIIVADGLLNYVPFEVLGKASRGQDFRSYPYLLRRYYVAYAGSAHLLLEQNKQVKQLWANPAPELFVGFAPTYNDGDTLSKAGLKYRAILVREGKYGLPGAVKEVEEISRLMNGHAFFDTQASKLQFRALAPRYRILHLAMHAMTEENNPLFSRLLFTQGKEDSIQNNELSAIELYAMHLLAELVVLSACNTGIGKIYKGEGSINLSRAFHAAGVPATVVTLWSAPDEVSRQLMVMFYRKLKAGSNKDIALRQAKLEFLAACKTPALANPYYWAGFIGVGAMHRIRA